LSLSQGKESEFSSFFFLFHIRTHALFLCRSFSREKKEKRIYRSSSTAGCCYIFYVIPPSVAQWTMDEREKKEKKKSSSSCVKQNWHLLSSMVNVYETENIKHIRSSNTSCLCLEKRQLWYVFYELKKQKYLLYLKVSVNIFNDWLKYRIRSFFVLPIGYLRWKRKEKKRGKKYYWTNSRWHLQKTPKELIL